MNFKLLAAAASVASLAGAPANAVNIVTNGGFETGGFDGWTQFGDPFNTGVAGTEFFGQAFEGDFKAFFGHVGSTGGIFQTLSTTINRTYSYRFALAAFDGAPNSFAASISGVNVAAFSNTPDFPYTVYSGSFVAASSATDLRFTFRHDPSFFLLDAVSVDEVVAAVPEPASWAMMIFGFGVVGGAMRYRRYSTKVAFA